MSARTVTCRCDASFDAEVPDLIDLDASPEYLDAILTGRFMSYTCPNCGKTLKPEFTVSLESKKRSIKLVMVPETERYSVYQGATRIREGYHVVIGFPELLDRVRVIEAGLDAGAVETMKYFLYLKAEEASPDGDISIYFASMEGKDLVFHIYGIRKDEVAVMKAPEQVYEKALGDIRQKPDEYPFKAILTLPYISALNSWKEEA